MYYWFQLYNWICSFHGQIVKLSSWIHFKIYHKKVKLSSWIHFKIYHKKFRFPEIQLLKIPWYIYCRKFSLFNKKPDIFNDNYVRLMKISFLCEYKKVDFLFWIMWNHFLLMGNPKLLHTTYMEEIVSITGSIFDLHY